MSATSLLTKYYKNKPNPTLGENKPNSKPIQSQTNPISEKPKTNASVYFTRNYENNPTLPLRQNKPNQSQFKPNFADPTCPYRSPHLRIDTMSQPHHWYIECILMHRPALYQTSLANECFTQEIPQWIRFC
jgi:hypothetical protein